MKYTPSNKQQNGSVFFYILIAVVLLAALSYAVSRDSRNNATILTDQQAKVAAQSIIEQGQTVSNALQKLLLRNIDETKISFENPIDAGYTLSTCTENICKIFDINGGGLNWIYPPENANDGTNWLYVGDAPIADIGPSLRNDITMILPNINQAVCQEINFKLGLSTTNNAPILNATDTTITVNKLATGNTISDSSNYLNGAGIDRNSSMCLSIITVSGDYAGSNQNYYVHTVYGG